MSTQPTLHLDLERGGCPASRHGASGAGHHDSEVDRYDFGAAWSSLWLG